MPAPALEELRQIVNKYAANGVPEDLVAAAKKAELAQAEFQRNSIPGLAQVWSQALAAEGRTSPEEDIDAIRKVTLADVNRVAKQYLLNANTITATLEAGAHRTAGRLQRLWRRREGDLRSHQARAAAGMGGEAAGAAPGSLHRHCPFPTPSSPTASA